MVWPTDIVLVNSLKISGAVVVVAISGNQNLFYLVLSLFEISHTYVSYGRFILSYSIYNIAVTVHGSHARGIISFDSYIPEKCECTTVALASIQCYRHVFSTDFFPVRYFSTIYFPNLIQSEFLNRVFGWTITVMPSLASMNVPISMLFAFA